MGKDDSSTVIAINMVEMLNSPEAFQRMQLAGPKMCMLTASQPGFLGYQANYQMGILPMAGRYGGGSPNMMQALNPLALWQYTVWEQQASHDEFHQGYFARAFEICAHCFPVIVKGPWEPIYSVVAAEMPEIRSPGQIAALAGQTQQRYAPPQRVVALGVHTVKPGEEAAFEQGVVATMQALADSPGYLGYMLMKQIGVSPWGSLQLDPESMIEIVQTFGAHAPSDPTPLFRSSQAAGTPREYLVHSEWESAELAAAGLGRVGLDREVRMVHNQGVVAHLIYGPYVMLFAPMMEEPGWRKALA